MIGHLCSIESVKQNIPEIVQIRFTSLPPFPYVLTLQPGLCELFQALQVSPYPVLPELSLLAFEKSEDKI